MTTVANTTRQLSAEHKKSTEDMPTNAEGIDWSTEQQAFEHWFVKTQTNNNYRRIAKHEGNGPYINLSTAIVWRAWRQAVMRATAKKVTANCQQTGRAA